MFVFFGLKARGVINAANRAGNTDPHHGGSRTFARHFELAAAQHPEGAQRYVEAFKTVYRPSPEDQVNI